MVSDCPRFNQGIYFYGIAVGVARYARNLTTFWSNLHTDFVMRKFNDARVYHIGLMFLVYRLSALVVNKQLFFLLSN